jgi:uncharacterized protein
MPRVVHFEIGVDDPDRAIKFYGDVFGWKTSKWDGPADYWLIQTGTAPEPGIDGAFARRGPNALTTNTISVPSVDKAIVKILDAGGKIIMPKYAIPGIGWLAYFQDPEGNVYGIMEDNPGAK